MTKSKVPFEVVLLGAGFGTRIGGSEGKAKGLLEYKGSTIIEHLIRKLSGSLGMVSFAMITNEKFAAEYEAVFQKYREQFTVHLISNGVLTATDQKKRGALVDLGDALNHAVLRDKPLLVLSIDTIFEEPGFFENFERVIKTHPHDFATVMRRFDSPDSVKGRLGCARMDGDRVTEFLEKPDDPPANHDSRGDFWLGAVPFYYYPLEAVKLLKKYLADPANNRDAPGNIIPYLIKMGFPVHASITEGLTLDVGTLADFTALQNLH
ncbi:MAG: sugar phosphate nucleotidyltransferase [Patescibacteria group bacterium]|jgi:NDP-sugar pyrophosphorylase family protein